MMDVVIVVVVIVVVVVVCDNVNVVLFDVAAEIVVTPHFTSG